MAKGAIWLHREIQDHWLWKKSKPFSWGQAWIDLVLLATHKDEKIPYKGKITTLGRGELIRSQRDLAARWGWSRASVERFLILLESDAMIARKPSQKASHINICNYDKWQDLRAKNEPIVSHERANSEPPVSLYNNVKNVKNVKEERKRKGNGQAVSLPNWIREETWTAYLEMRTRIKKPATENAKSLVIKKLEQLKAEGQDPNQVLEQSIMNSWQSIYPVKHKQHENGGWQV